MTDTNFSSSLYEALSVADLTGLLHERMKAIRPKISRNTILLAFKEDSSTPLRRRILEEARIILDNHRSKELHGPTPFTTALEWQTTAGQ